MSCIILMFSKMYVFWQKLPLKSIQPNYKNKKCVFTQTSSLQLYVYYLNILPPCVYMLDKKKYTHISHAYTIYYPV